MTALVGVVVGDVEVGGFPAALRACWMGTRLLFGDSESESNSQVVSPRG